MSGESIEVIKLEFIIVFWKNVLNYWYDIFILKERFMVMRYSIVNWSFNYLFGCVLMKILSERIFIRMIRYYYCENNFIEINEIYIYFKWYICGL